MGEEQECDSFNSWELNGLNSLDLWDYTVELECLQGSEDLQLAAELGKTLLERNKELETALRQHQNVIEDQAQEIEYLTKQTVALREVNDSRLRIYEQLEVSIQELERANHRLASDHAGDKKHIKTLCSNIEALENKCEELQKTVDDLNAQLDIARRRAERKSEPSEKPKEPIETSKPLEPVTPNSKKPEISSTPIKSQPLPLLTKDDEDLLRISDELRESKVAFAQEQRRVTELEEQLASMVQENNRLQEQLRNWHQREDEPKSMHEEFSILEEVMYQRRIESSSRGHVQPKLIGTSSNSKTKFQPGESEPPPRSALMIHLCNTDVRNSTLIWCVWGTVNDHHPSSPPRQGQLCIRCLRGVGADDMSSILDGDDDDRSAISSLILSPSGQESPRHDVTSKLVKFDNAKEKLLQGIWANKDDHDNPYRELVQKYEALLEVQLAQVKGVRKAKAAEESADALNTRLKDTDDESGHGDDHKDASSTTQKAADSRKKFIQTPDFSEAETSSSGFSDETSNKATQTERERPGSFLCTIADGQDYRFSIYDDASPVDSHFRNRPEYRELFKEIFTILKKAAENKDEGERLPLLDDAGKVPPVTPVAPEPPTSFAIPDDASILSSAMSERSLPVSDLTVPDVPDVPEAPVTPAPSDAPASTHSCEDEQDKGLPSKEKGEEKTDEKPKEKVLTPLVRQPLEYIAATRKKSRHRNRKHSQDRQGADSPVFPSPPKIIYQKSSSKKRRDYRPLEVSPLVKPVEGEWNGTTMQFYNRNLNSPTPSASGRAAPARIYQGWNAETDSWDIKQSTASQEIHKLRKLELSYAEVLRNADKTKNRRKKHQ
ncbi:Cerebellar degeneration-related protein 2-like [Eumeta japonica]|uniref:Cerebellar degeneration-related protein 2-like n=1 Tax=Eumeta variegata TaxID=151549 RepID=A0A4C1TI03_EUMVA|nr:Cerebellar degeneration-related protein 2-like [Eumeta japonica]